MGQTAVDKNATSGCLTVEFAEREQQLRQALKDGARAKHLEKGRVTFPLEDEAFNETGGQPRQLSHQLLKVIPSKM